MRTIKDTLTLEDARRLTGPLAFNLMLKPAGSLCNLDCSYCYYLDKSGIYGGREPRMSMGDLERFVRSYIEACDVPEVTFNWHGGEPLVLGLEFYRKAVEFQNQYKGDKIIHNTLQTNATLLTDEWAHFFAEQRFLLGVSVDGPSEVHDRYRKDRGGMPSLERVVCGIRKLHSAGAEYNLMATINSASEGRGLQVYQFLKGLGSAFIQFSPVVEHVVWPMRDGKPDKHSRPHIVDPSEDGAVLAPWSVSPVGFGRFLCDIFDYWVKHDVGRVFVNYFDCTLANWCGVMPGTCSFAETCGGNAVVEHNGDVYSCDHFVYPKYLIGNIYRDSLREMMKSPAQLRFGIDKRNALPRKCLRCEFWTLCHGGCPKHRFNSTDNGQTGLNALCEGFRMFFGHSASAMKRMKELLEQQKAPALIMMQD
ncbi:MAG: anaerobic sulfatase maturase [Bacteroidales bacterium]|nr:anaerobic sulfatase maturase [Bacteroidales bacterium]